MNSGGKLPIQIIVINGKIISQLCYCCPPELLASEEDDDEDGDDVFVSSPTNGSDGLVGHIIRRRVQVWASLFTILLFGSWGVNGSSFLDSEGLAPPVEREERKLTHESHNTAWAVIWAVLAVVALLGSGVHLMVLEFPEQGKWGWPENMMGEVLKSLGGPTTSSEFSCSDLKFKFVYDLLGSLERRPQRPLTG